MIVDGWTVGAEWEMPTRAVVWRYRSVALPTNAWSVTAERTAEPSLVVELEVAADQSGPHCKELRVRGADGGELRSSDLRKIPVAAFVRRSAMHIAMDIANMDASSVALEPPTKSLQGEDLPEVARRRGPLGRPRGESVPRAVELYRREIAKGNRRPRKVIADEMGYGVDYVGQLLFRARRRGLLEPWQR